MNLKHVHRAATVGVLRPLAGFLLLLTIALNLSGCDPDRRVTRIYGKVTDTNQQPVANVQIVIEGEMSFLGGSDVLATLTTDTQGLYGTTIEPDKKYIGLLLNNVFRRDPILASQYKEFFASYNGKPNPGVYSPLIGETNEYNFTMVPK